MVTIEQVSLIQLEENNIVNFHINRNQTIGGLNIRPINDSFNQGPYIDILECSFKPMEANQCPLIFDSIGPTKQNEISLRFRDLEGFAFEGGPMGKIGSGNAQNPISWEAGFGPKVNFKGDSEIIAAYKKSEFQQKSYLYGEKKTISLQLSTCYKDQKPIQYEIQVLSSLRCSNLGSRLAIGFLVPVYGQLGGFLHCPDTLYSLPACANSSFGMDWKLKYSFSKKLNMDFEWSTEVRTVFASNDSYVPYGNAMGDTLNWIKTIHKTTQIFNVEIIGLPGAGISKELSIKLRSRKELRVCAIGHEKTTTRSFLQEGELHDPEEGVVWKELQTLTDEKVKEFYDKKSDIAEILRKI
jgi:hypothetical protein